MRRTVLIVSALLASTIDVRAGQFDTGNDFLSLCANALLVGNCTGSAVGYTDMLNLLGLVCLNGNVTKGQVRDVIKKYMQDHPAERSHPAASLAYSALTEAFPCKK
jgi:hypothetical protein